MGRLQFEFMIKQSSDGKTNVMAIISITTESNKSFAIPEELQPISLHKAVTKTTIYSMVKNSLKRRHQLRRVWMELTEEIQKTYMDDYGNMMFADQILEEITERPAATNSEEITTLNKILEKLVENTQKTERQSLKSISERFVIEKFTSKNSNANQWMDIFEKECTRFDVTDDERKIEILRLFMDKSCIDWYSSMIMKLTLHSEWTIWKEKFCETFANQGWNPVTYALLFKYRDGSLLDYAIRKEKLLLEMRRSIDSGTLVDLIAAGLPEFILNKIDRGALKDAADLFTEVNRYEHMVNKKNVLGKKRNVNLNTKGRNEEHKPCKICEKLNKGTRYHPEETCWFKTKEDDKNKKSFIKHVNNSVIEAELLETDQKNE